MAARGWLYVLVNSSMPGLVKVGKTTRDPVTRAAELSGVTSVPTPFILAYHQRFADCDWAEREVHDLLSRKGCREASNREFFRAEASDVVHALVSLVGAEPLASASTAYSPVEDIDLDLDLDETNFESNPWDDVIRDAEAAYYGHDDTIQDYAEAMELYQDARRLGAPISHRFIGKMYADGEGTRVNRAEAVKYFKLGASAGDYYCYAGLGRIYQEPDVAQYENADKCWTRFFTERAKGKNLEFEEHGLSFAYEFFSYALSLAMTKRSMSDTIRATLSEHKVDFSQAFRELEKRGASLNEIKPIIELL